MKKPKTLGHLLVALKKLTPEELKKPAIYDSKSLFISGIVTGFGKAPATLYWSGGDDPSELKTKKEWLAWGSYNRRTHYLLFHSGPLCL